MLFIVPSGNWQTVDLCCNVVCVPASAWNQFVARHLRIVKTEDDAYVDTCHETQNTVWTGLPWAHLDKLCLSLHLIQILGFYFTVLRRPVQSLAFIVAWHSVLMLLCKARVKNWKKEEEIVSKCSFQLYAVHKNIPLQLAFRVGDVFRVHALDPFYLL